MKFLCEQCKTRYSIGDDRVRGKILKIRCKNCANVITVREGMPSPEATEAAAAGAARRASKATTAAPAAQSEALAPRAAAAAAPPSALEEEWYVSIDGDQHGPFTLAEAQRWVAAKPVDADLYCWSEGFDDWLPVDRVSHFRAARRGPGAAAPPAVPPAVPTPAGRGGARAPGSARSEGDEGATVPAGARGGPAASSGAAARADHSGSPRSARLAHAPTQPGALIAAHRGSEPAIGARGRAPLAPALPVDAFDATEAADAADSATQIEAAPYEARRRASADADRADPFQRAVRGGGERGVGERGGGERGGGERGGGPGGGGRVSGEAAAAAPTAASAASAAAVARPRSGSTGSGSAAVPFSSTGSSGLGAGPLPMPVPMPMPGPGGDGPPAIDDDDLDIGEVSRVVSLADLARSARGPRPGAAARAPVAIGTRSEGAGPALLPGIAAGPGPALGAPGEAAEAGAAPLLAPEANPPAVAAAHRRGMIALWVGAALLVGAAGAVVAYVLTRTEAASDRLGEVGEIDTTRPDEIRPGSGGSGPGSAGAQPGGSADPSGPRVRRPPGGATPGSGAGPPLGAAPPVGTGARLEAREIEEMASRSSGITQRCYMRAQRGADGILIGDVKKIAVTLTIGPDGAVTDAQLSDNHGANTLGKCLIGALRTWRFRPSPGGTFRFVLHFG